MEPFVGEIRVFAYNIIPNGWHVCDGSTLSIQSYTALYALIGTKFGGNGTSTFGLPDLRGAAMVCEKVSDPNYQMGANGGAETVTLTSTTTPLHTHSLSAQSENGGFLLNPNPPFEVLAGTTMVPLSGDSVSLYYNNPTPAQLTPLSASTLSNTGGAPHSNMPPFLVLNICIALTGYWPPRN